MRIIFNNTLVKTTGIYAAANLLNAAIPFLLLPYLTNQLSTADYGIVAMFQVLFSIFNPLVGFSSESAISKRFFHLTRPELQSYNFNVAALQLYSIIPFAAIIFLFGGWIADLSDFPKLWLWAVLLYSLTNKFLEIVLALLRLENKALGFGSFKVGKTLVELIFTFVFISALNQTWDGRISAQLVASVVILLPAIYISYRNKYFAFKPNKQQLINALKYGFPLIPHALGATIITYSDRLFITNMVNLEALGIYSVGYQVGMAIGLIQTSINQAYIPWLFQQLKHPQQLNKKQLVKGIYLYNLALLLLVVILYFLIPFIFSTMIGDGFGNASDYVLWIGLAFAVNGMYKMVVAFLFYTENTKIIGLGTLITALINVVLNYFFILRFGAIGAAYATLISFAIQYLVIWYFSQKYYPMPWFSLK